MSEEGGEKGRRNREGWNRQEQLEDRRGNDVEGEVMAFHVHFFAQLSEQFMYLCRTRMYT